MLRCSSCYGAPSVVGVLCRGECPWEPGREWFQCRACVAAELAFVEDMRVMAANLADRADHYAACPFCYSRKGLFLPGPLQMACIENRKALEAKQRKAAA